MSEVLTIVNIPKRSGIPADVIQNTWVFHTGSAVDADGLDEIAYQLDRFYNTAAGSNGPVNVYFGNAISIVADAVEIAFYDITAHLNGTPHGSPIGARTMQIDTTSATGLPAELAVTLTYHRPYGTDVEFGAGGTRPRARDRGRVYLGPLGVNTVDRDATTNEPFVSASCRNGIAEQAGQLLDDGANSAAHNAGAYVVQWAQWSRVDTSVGIVEAGWVDNAFDVQRRRGNEATARSTFG